jgi:pimeloyl-ACP methyl ester carboxylesterase
VDALNLEEVTLAGESMGATISLTASTLLEERVRRIVAFNPYDYSRGVGRANAVAAVYTEGARLPGIGMVVARMENRPVLGLALRGGLRDHDKLPAHYLIELRRVGRRPGYARVARKVYRRCTGASRR